MTRLPSSFALFALALAPLLPGCASAPPLERYGFLARLGRDTISVENIARYRDRIVSDEVDRFPDVRRRHTELELAADGSIRHMDMQVRIPSALARSRERRIVADFTRDTVRVSLTDGGGTRVMRLGTGGVLTIPHVPQMYGLIELYFAAALARGAADHVAPGASIPLRQFYPDREFSHYPVPMHRGSVRAVGHDTVELRHDWLAGIGVAVLDSNRRMMSYSGDRTTYKVAVVRLADPPDVQAIGERFAATEKARGGVVSLSVRDTVRATIGRAAFTVDYGRPLARGRILLGNVIPYDYVWRTGANAATQFTTTADIMLGTIALAPGTYTLWTLPHAGQVSLIVNRQTGQWGTEHDTAHDIGMTPLASAVPTTPVEQFTISITGRDQGSGVLALAWGSFLWTADITVR
jgi:hypothetical protein